MYESFIKCELKINEEGLVVNFKMAFASSVWRLDFLSVLFAKTNMFISSARNRFITKWKTARF